MLKVSESKYKLSRKRFWVLLPTWKLQVIIRYQNILLLVSFIIILNVWPTILLHLIIHNIKFNKLQALNTKYKAILDS